METEEALMEGLLEANAQGILTCKICDIRVVDWKVHSGGSKHEKNEINRQEKILNEIKRKKREDEKEDQELSLETALQKGIVKVKDGGKLACKICKVEMKVWNQHSRSEHHRKEKLKKDEEVESREEGKDEKKKEEQLEEVEEKKEKEESDVTMKDLEKLLFSFEKQPENEKEGDTRADYFLQQAKIFAQWTEV